MSLPTLIESDPKWGEFLSSLPTDPVPSQPFSAVCDMCETNAATMYCGQDKAHLCEACDAEHHSKTKLLMNHVRNPIFHSPFQFGVCPHHSTYRCETVCLECGEMLCELCLLVGSHATLSNHPIVSTIAAFRMSLGDSDSECPMREIRRKKDSMISLLKQYHGLVVQAESNHGQIQQTLDKQLRALLENLSRLKQKRLQYVHALRRETLLMLTLVEWFEAFLVHARLALPPASWLTLFHRVTCEGSGAIFFGNPMMPAVESVAAYVNALPNWGSVEVDGFIEVYVGTVPKRSLNQTGKKIISNFDFLPNPAVQVPPTDASPETLRTTRMAARMDELLGPETVQPIPFNPIPEKLRDPVVPIDNIKDFVMQTLAVLAHAEDASDPVGVIGGATKSETGRESRTVEEVSKMTHAKTVSEFPDVGSETPKFTHSKTFTQDSAPTKLNSAKTLAKLPDMAPEVPELEPLRDAKNIDAKEPSLPAPTSVANLRQIIRGGELPFGNAASVIMTAPGSERQELIRLFCALLEDDRKMRTSLSEANDLNDVEGLVQAVCREAAAKIDAASFLVSGMSVLVPLTAAFMLWLYPKDAVFLDVFLKQAIVSTPKTESPEQAEVAVCQLVSSLGPAAVFPTSTKFLLKSIHDACVPRFGSNIALGVTSGIFLARIVAPRLLWAAPKSSDNIQAPPLVTLMTRFIHRAATAAAEGNQTLLQINTKAADQHQINISTCVTHTNALIARTIVNAEDQSVHCPAPSTLMSPKSAAVKIERRIQEYGHGVLYV